MKRFLLLAVACFAFAGFGCVIDYGDNWDYDDDWTDNTDNGFNDVVWYEVVFESAEIEPLNPSTGQPWDPMSDADPCAMVQSNSNWDATPVAFQTHNPQWDYAMYFTYDDLDSIWLWMGDEDMPGDDCDTGEPDGPDDPCGDYDEDDDESDEVCDEYLNIQPPTDTDSQTFDLSPEGTNGLIRLTISVRPAN